MMTRHVRVGEKQLIVVKLHCIGSPIGGRGVKPLAELGAQGPSPQTAAVSRSWSALGGLHNGTGPYYSSKNTLI